MPSQEQLKKHIEMYDKIGIRTIPCYLERKASLFKDNKKRLDFGVDNLLNRFYAQPLGGAYLGQGAAMSSQGIAWGVVVPGPARSVNVALSLRF